MDNTLDAFSRLRLLDDDLDNSTSDEEEETDLEGVITVNTVLLPSDNQNAYRVRNKAEDPYQRKTGSDHRKGAVRIQCKIVDVVHGTLAADDQTSNATLIVFQCAFSSKRHSRRAASVDIEFVFKGLRPDDPDPEVLDIAPKDKTCLMPETLHETVTREASGGVNAPLVGGVGAEGSVMWQKTEARDKTKYITVIGESALYDKDEGEANSAAWTLLENPISQEGVPQSFRGAILLKRVDATSHFQCDLKITAKTDRWTALSGLFKSTPLDDPVLFDPRLPSTNKLRAYTTNKLGDVVLRDFEEITFMKVKSGVVVEERLVEDKSINKK
ncbi:hypothetical protein DL770_009788 [Monosporascus sp. CRB-9-2]|nr:hypothetical protein DL770_009788 [Monosporascus sp. CRB-9-2]